MENDLAGNRGLQATTEANKATRITAMTVQLIWGVSVSWGTKKIRNPHEL